MKKNKSITTQSFKDVTTAVLLALTCANYKQLPTTAAAFTSTCYRSDNLINSANTEDKECHINHPILYYDNKYNTTVMPPEYWNNTITTIQ